MRAVSFAAIFMFFSVLCMSSVVTAGTKYVEVKKPFVNVYEYLDPKSTVIQQAKKGDYFELIYEGTSWYQVKTQSKVGWLEKRAGDIVEKANSFSVFGILLLILICAGAFGGAGYFIYKQKNTPAESD